MVSIGDGDEDDHLHWAPACARGGARRSWGGLGLSDEQQAWGSGEAEDAQADRRGGALASRGSCVLCRVEFRRASAGRCAETKAAATEKSEECAVAPRPAEGPPPLSAGSSILRPANPAPPPRQMYMQSLETSVVQLTKHNESLTDTVSRLTREIQVCKHVPRSPI